MGSGSPISKEHRLTKAPTKPWTRPRRSSVPEAIRKANPGMKFRYVRVANGRDLSKLEDRLEDQRWCKPIIPKDNFEGRVADKNRDASQISSMYRRGDTVLVGITPENDYARRYALQETADRKRKLVADQHDDRVERTFGKAATTRLPQRVQEEIDKANADGG